MLKFIIKRILYGILTMFITASITFFLVRIIPGNPIETIAENLPETRRAELYSEYGFDKPLTAQYFIFWKNLFTRGDLGTSLYYRGRKVTDVIKTHAPVSALLGLQALLLGVTIGLSFGISAAANRGKKFDYAVILIAVAGISIPSFVVAQLLQYYFGIKYTLLPITGWGSFKYTVLPSIALTVGPIAKYSRYMRSNYLDIINKEYILTARAKGASKNKIIRSHILRNASLPVITMLGPQIAFTFTGTFIVENIFSVPGLGSYFVHSISERDYTMVMGQTVFISFLYIISLIIVDIAYALIDPRIKAQLKKEM
ncbi:ABC transporter permease [Treponema pedis]|uniref:ABC transporter permease n=1 Tax=Treponema pedis TaxID=409322 RepID=A0A7S7AWD8_9SPIR|nr:ABC transporter permease [Treponema pedis]QOW60802.1 ABC transporter permease [Treponema pedis]